MGLACRGVAAGWLGGAGIELFLPANYFLTVTIASK